MYKITAKNIEVNENDIVKIIDDNEYNYLIRWSETRSGFYLWNLNKSEWYEHRWGSIFISDLDLKIVASQEAKEWKSA